MPERHTTQSQDECSRSWPIRRPMAAPTVTRIDTHGAAVFLAGDRVLKVKRAVKFPFLDYSTREKRKAACEAELRVNKLFAPRDLSRRPAITRDQDGHLAIGGDGETVEWALEMRRFDESATLDHLAEAGRIDDCLADALARSVAAAHRSALPVEADPWIDALDSYIGQNEQAFARIPGSVRRTKSRS